MWVEAWGFRHKILRRRFFLLQVIGINNQFPGPLLNVTTNQNVRVNVQNNLDEPLLITWYLLLLMMPL